MRQSVAQSILDKRIARMEEMLEALMQAQGLKLPEAQTGGVSPKPTKTFVSTPPAAPPMAEADTPAPVARRKRAAAAEE